MKDVAFGQEYRQMIDKSAPANDLRRSAGWRRFVVPSVGDVLFVTILSLALAIGPNLTHRDGDLAKHLRLGASVIDEGTLPTRDIYSHTMTGGEMVPHEWLSQTVLAGTERLFGFDGIGILAAILVSLPWFILYRWMVARGIRIGLAVILTLLGATASMVHWAARPHAFTWLFVVAWVILLEDLRNGRRLQVWVLVPLAMLWANTHGAFPVGFVLLGTYLVGDVIERRLKPTDNARSERTRHLSMVLLATIAISFANPTGWRIVAHPFIHLGDEFLFDFTREFNSPNFHNLFFWPFLAMIILSLFLTPRLRPTGLLLLGSWTALGLYSFRHIPLYALVVIPLFARAMQEVWPRSIRLGERWRAYSAIERSVTGGSLSLVVVGLAALSLSQTPGSDFEFKPGGFPVTAVESIVEDPPGERVFNQFVWGGYLVYCCHPEIPVFIDGQTDYYGPALTRDYDQAIRGLPRWNEIFLKYDVDWVLISPDTGLAQVLDESSVWTETYRDETTVIFKAAR